MDEDRGIIFAMLRIATTGMHEMPEVLAGNLQRIGYNAMNLADSIKDVFKYRKKYDVLIVIFPHRRILAIIIAKLLGKKVIVHWIGTDCLLVQDNPFKLQMKLISHLIDSHVADSPNLVEELKAVGISASFISIVPKMLRIEPFPMPDKLRVLSYIMPDRPEFYRADMIAEIASQMPDVEFIIIEEGKVPNPPPNIKHLGFIPPEKMAGVYSNASVFLRLTVHDGISKSVLESLGFGRYVIRTFEFPACFKANSTDEVVEILNSLKGVKEPNMEGVRFIDREFNWTRIADKWREVLQSI